MPRVILLGTLPSFFYPGLAEQLGGEAELKVLPPELSAESDRRAFADADIIITVYFTADMPRPSRLKLLHLPNAGTDGIDFAALPPDAIVCNCYGHGAGIAEYVMAALLQHHVPLTAASRHLREGDWSYRADPDVRPAREELAHKTIGILGYGHIGKAVAQRAKAFEMTVHVANRSPVETCQIVDRYYGFDTLLDFCASADFIVSCLPLAPETKEIMGPKAFAAMRARAIVVNVGRGLTIDEAAFYEALRAKRIGGAIIDTWYNYPTPDSPKCFPSQYPFHELENVVMTPHMAAWTKGMMQRRIDLMAENIRRRLRGEPCVNVVPRP